MYAIDSLAPMYPLYADVMGRDTFTDFGQSAVTGNVSISPDIIPIGGEPLINPKEELAKNWNVDLGKSLTAEAYNMIYMRGISHAPQKTKAKFYLYYSKNITQQT
jgi:hypothetical protein